MSKIQSIDPHMDSLIALTEVKNTAIDIGNRLAGNAISSALQHIQGHLLITVGGFLVAQGVIEAIAVWLNIKSAYVALAVGAAMVCGGIAINARHAAKTTAGRGTASPVG